MPQYARPDADGSFVRWTASAGADYACVDEATTDDADYISAVGGIHATPDEVFSLSNLTDPATSAGHKITVRAKSSTGTTSITCSLYQGDPSFGGGTLITTFSVGTLTTAFADYVYTLTAGEANSISDYTDLWLLFDRTTTGSVTQYISQSYFEVPQNSAFAQIVVFATAQSGSFKGGVLAVQQIKVISQASPGKNSTRRRVFLTT